MKNEIARVIAEHKEAYEVKNAEGEYFAKITGKRMFEASSREDYPAVGDWVRITDLDGENAVIRDILPRKTIIKRSSGDKSRLGAKNETQIIAANVDVAFVVESLDRDYSLNRFERYFALVKDGGVTPVIVLNKVDLLSPADLDKKVAELKNRFPDIEVIPTSIARTEHLERLKKHIVKDKTYCFLGSSGVGKSSLINKLLGEEVIKTVSVSTHSGRGKHTTTGRQMYFLPGGGVVIDNPGVREVGMADVGDGVADLFDDLNDLAQECKYADCTHTHEPGCQIIEAVKSGKLDEARCVNFLRLKREAEYYELTELEKRDKDYQFGKLVKKAKKELKDWEK